VFAVVDVSLAFSAVSVYPFAISIAFGTVVDFGRDHPFPVNAF
jgi:hypothetical protein